MQLTPTLALKQKRLLAITPELRQAIGLLQMGAADLNRFIRQQCDENPLLKVSSKQPQGEAGKTSAEYNPTGPADSTQISAPAILDYTDPLAHVSAKPGLIEHVLAQLGYCRLTHVEMPVALCFVEGLEPTGWLGIEVDDVSKRTGASVSGCEAVLRKLQQIEPTGLFSRTLAECLSLQLEDIGEMDKGIRAILDHLPELADLGPEQFASEHGFSSEYLLKKLALLRSLNPKPGSGFSSTRTPVIIPDMIAEKKNGQWFVALNGSALPKIEVDTELSKHLSSDNQADHFKQCFGSAKWIVSAIRRRQETLLKIGAELVRQQSAFLERGPDALRPLLQKDIADKLEISESTVSRVANAVYIQTPTVNYPLKRFFCKGLPTSGSDEMWSATRIQSKIKEIIALEDQKKPLSDGAITEQLGEVGITIARRTVAKYRELAGVPGKARRRRFQA